MLHAKSALGIMSFLLAFLFLISLQSVSGDERVMYQVDASNSGYFPESSDNNTFSPIPIWEEETTFTIYSNPILIDIDEDGVKDIIYAADNGRVKALGSDYQLLWEFKTNATEISTPAAADIDKDGDIDIVFVANEEDAVLYCIDHKGEQKWNFSLPSFSPRSFPTIAELLNKPGLEILISSGQHTQGPGTSTAMYCLSSQGEEMWRFFSNQLHYNIISTPVVVDIDYDGSPEIIFGITGDGGIHVLDNERKSLWEVSPGFRYTSATVSNIDQSGPMEILIGVDNSLYCYNNNGEERWQVGLTEPLFATPFARDIDGDGNVEILAASDFLYCFKADGTLKWKSPLNEKVHSSSISFADINSGLPEILFGDINGTLYAFSGTGERIWEIQYGNEIQSSPFLADLDDDGKPELFTTIGRGNRVITSFLDLPITSIVPEFDLEIGIVNMQPIHPVDNHEITFTTEIINKGNVFSSAEVILVVDNMTVDSKFMAIPAPKELEESYSIETTLRWIGETGDHHIQIIIDPYQEVDEVSEANNKYATDITVVAEFIDLVIDRDDITVSRIEDIEFYRLSIKIKNIGNLPSGNFSMKLTINGIEEIFPDISLNPTSFTIKRKTLTIDQGYNFLISVELDPEDKVQEVNETNNLADKIVSLGEKDDPSSDDPLPDNVWYLLLLLPIIILGVLLYYSSKSNRKNYDSMQNTLEELTKNMRSSNDDRRDYREDRYYWDDWNERYGRPRERPIYPADYYERSPHRHDPEERSTSHSPPSGDPAPSTPPTASASSLTPMASSSSSTPSQSSSSKSSPESDPESSASTSTARPEISPAESSSSPRTENNTAGEVSPLSPSSDPLAVLATDPSPPSDPPDKYYILKEDNVLPGKQ